MSVLMVSSPSLAASDEELGRLSDKMNGAFRCSAYAGMFHDQKEEQRLFQIGLKAGREFVEGIKGLNYNDPAFREITEYIRGASTDFMVGSMWQDTMTKADNEIRKRLPRERWDPDAAESEAQRSYRNGNCFLIQ
jgi:hypothetical protein